MVDLEEMIAEGMNADQDRESELVKAEFKRLKRLDWTWREIIDYITEEYRIPNPEIYLEKK